MANLLGVISRSFGGLGEIKKGLGTVFKHTFREPITKNYPDEPPKLAIHFRGRLALTVNPETGENLCISCRQCERVCPDKCIEITSHKDPETNKLQLIDFKIDHGLCMFCGLCTEVCPTYCIINTNDFEMADYSRESLIYDLKKLTLGQDESAFYFEGKGNPLPKPKPVKAAAPAAAAAKPADGAAAAAMTEAKSAAKPAEAKPAVKPAEAKPEVKPAEAKPEVKDGDKPADSASKPAEPLAADTPAEAKLDEAKKPEAAAKADEKAADVKGESEKKTEEITEEKKD